MLFVLNRWDKLGQLYVFMVLQHHCQNCNKLFIKTPNHGHYLCAQCNNLRLHPSASETTTITEPITPLFELPRQKHLSTVERARLSFANGYLHMTQDDWMNIMFADEKKFKGEGFIGQMWVRRFGRSRQSSLRNTAITSSSQTQCMGLFLWSWSWLLLYIQ
jgi:hypothetical protein